MAFKRNKIEYVSPEEMNKLLKEARLYKIVKLREKRPEETFANHAYIEDKEINFKLSVSRAGKPVTYVCRKDGSSSTQEIDGIEAFRILSLYYKVPKMPEDICGKTDAGGLAASPLLWYNERYNGTRQKAIGYDINSAYAFAMMGPMPDTSVKPRSGIIKFGKEIGFREVLNPKRKNEATMLEVVYEGRCGTIFPLMDTPFKGFVEHWYGIKSRAINSKEKNKAKCVLNYAVGYLQMVNPYLRATIVCRCNDLVKRLIDPNTTLFCNTDSIVSTVPIEGIKIGDGLGEWKVEHTGEVAYVGNNHQWNNDPPSYRGISKRWFQKNWDILKDKPPKCGNVWEFDKEKIRLVRKNGNI